MMIVQQENVPSLFTPHYIPPSILPPSLSAENERRQALRSRRCGHDERYRTMNGTLREKISFVLLVMTGIPPLSCQSSSYPEGYLWTF